MLKDYKILVVIEVLDIENLPVRGQRTKLILVQEEVKKDKQFH